MITDKQKIAFFLFRYGEMVNKVALVCGVHRCTVWRWFQKKDVYRRYAIYSNLDYKRSHSFGNFNEVWQKYRDDKNALLSAVNSGNTACISQMYSNIIHDYYEPLEAKIELKMARKHGRSRG